MSEPISVVPNLPEHGQFIIGRSEKGFWLEEFDRSEPIGLMLEWKPITKEVYYSNIYNLASLQKLWNES